MGNEKKKILIVEDDNINYINLPVHFKGSYVCGKFFLYKEDEYGKLLNQLGNFSQ